MGKFFRFISLILVIVCGLAIGEVIASPIEKTPQKTTKSTTKSNKNSKTSKSAKTSKKPASGHRTAGDVRKEKQKTEKEITLTKEEIAANDKRTRTQLNRLGEIDAQIKISTGKVNVIQNKLDTLRTNVSQMSDTVEKTEDKVRKLRESYAKSLVELRRHRQGISDISFIFSSNNFSEMYARARYLRELTRAQNARTTELKTELANLKRQKSRLDSLEQQVSAALQNQKRENAILASNRSSASALVDSLRRHGNSLKKVLQEKQALARRLDAELDRIIAEEARKAAEEEARRKKAQEEARKKNQGGTSGKTPPSAGSDKTIDVSGPSNPLTGSFAANKGSLPWPIDRNATVIGEFGRSSHPELSRVDVQNNGIDLRAPIGAMARAVFRGNVSSIFRLDGYNNIVILRHGDYLTVYAGLSELNVRKGQDVSAGQTLGKIAPDMDDSSKAVLHFEIRREKQKLNPREWLRK